MIRVLLVDDHPVVRAGYKRLLETDASIQVVAEANDADSAYLAFVVYQPDVTVLDLSMPGVSGLGLLQKILMRDPQAKVLICSMYDSPLIKHKAREAGAKAFVSKNIAPETLLLSIRAVYLGEAAEEPASNLPEVSAEFQEELDRIASLTLRELELFRLLALGKTISFCAKAMNLNEKTVYNRQTKIREKLQVDTLAGLVHLAQRHHIIDANMLI
ncbi:MAG: DNA-binding response regulator [Betaproteobacteria bacterium]|jgi:DNA-binding NarL/FixJ family response regulator|nr:DNA-binding response regulator [Betaproteobacteria bacterium]